MKNELKAIMYAPYVGVVKIALKDDFALSGYSRTILDYGDCSSLAMDQISYDGCFIEVKSLLKITDNDAVEVAKMFTSDESYHTVDFGKNRLKGWEYKQFVSTTWLEVIQFLLSKGYALPYRQHTVEELVKAKVYKLI